MKEWKRLSKEKIIELHWLYKAPSFSLTQQDWERLKELSDAHYSSKIEQHSISLVNVVGDI